MINIATKRGNETHERIIRAAAGLIHRQGANGTSVDEILLASSTGKSQFYHYFSSKDELILAVLTRWVENSLMFASTTLGSSDDPRECIAALFDGAETSHSKHGCKHGCPVASLTLELGGGDGELRNRVEGFYQDFQSILQSKLEQMQTAGILDSPQSVDDLAVFISAAFHGSILLSTAQGNTRPIAVARQSVLAHLACSHDV